MAGKDSANCDKISKKKETYKNLGPTDIFKHKECRDATFALFIIWMSINLSMHFIDKIIFHYDKLILNWIIINTLYAFNFSCSVFWHFDECYEP